MRFDRKLLLIVPTIILPLVMAGTLYAAMELRVLSNVSSTWKDRSDFINAVARGDKALPQQHAVGLLQYALDVEARRTAAIDATRQLLVMLAVIGLGSCVLLAVGVRSVPREQWPRMRLGKETTE